MGIFRADCANWGYIFFSSGDSLYQMSAFEVGKEPSSASNIFSNTRHSEINRENASLDILKTKPSLEACRGSVGSPHSNEHL